MKKTLLLTTAIILGVSAGSTLRAAHEGEMMDLQPPMTSQDSKAHGPKDMHHAKKHHGKKHHGKHHGKMMDLHHPMMDLHHPGVIDPSQVNMKKLRLSHPEAF